MWSEQVGQGGVREGRFRLHRPGVEDGRAGRLRPGHAGPQQARLADSGRPLQKDRQRVSIRRLDCGDDACNRLVASDQGRDGVGGQLSRGCVHPAPIIRAAVGDSTDADRSVLLHGWVMQQTVRVLEVYVPGLFDRPVDWYERLQENVAAPLRADGLEIALLAIPTDETLMWLVWSRPGRSESGLDVAAVVLRELTGDSGATVIERAVDARLVWYGSARGGP